jgi:hypothetical protein
MSMSDLRGLLATWESIPEEEYDNLNCFSYSKLKEVHDNPRILYEKRVDKKGEWLVFGTVVDLLLTGSKEEFDKKIFVNDKKPSEQYLNICNYLIDNGLQDIEDIKNFTNDQISEVFTQSGSAVNWKPDTKRDKILSECGDYLDVLLNHKDQLIISTNTHKEAEKVAQLLRTHKWTKELFMSKREQEKQNIEIYYQYKIKYIYKGIVCKSKIDIVLVDHEHKLIYLYDLKTGSDHWRTFYRKSIYKYGYVYQAALYREGFTMFLNKHEEFKDYKILEFCFVYVNRLDPTFPVKVVIDESTELETIVYGKCDDFYLPPMNDLFVEAKSYMDDLDMGLQPTEPYELSLVEGELTLKSTNRDVVIFK